MAGFINIPRRHNLEQARRPMADCEATMIGNKVPVTLNGVRFTTTSPSNARPEASSTTSK